MSVGQGGSAGGSSQDVQAAVVSALEAGSGGGQGQTAPEQQTQPVPSSSPATPASTGAPAQNPFLEGVDPADRAIVEKYIKEWDAGVNKRFQELHGEIAPYKELGADPETMGQALQLMQAMDADPEGLIKALQEALGQDDQTPQGQPGQQQAQTVEDNPFDGLPPQFVEQFTQMREVLEMLAGNHIQQQEQQTQAQQDAELDKTLNQLKTQYGEFDEDYVLAKMTVGMDAEAAVKAYNELVQKSVNSRASAPPAIPILGGGGAAPAAGLDDIAKASSKDVRATVANILRNAQA